MSYDKSNIPIRAEPPIADYEVIDADPHFNKVVRYFRPSDYGVVAAGTAAFPLALQAWERFEPAAGAFKAPGKVPGSALRVATLLGFFGGFYLSYVRSSKRFLGWSENAREVKKDRYEVKKLLSQEQLPYKENTSVLDDRLKDVANRNSQYSFTVLGIFPWFNWANHPYHGVSIGKYYETRPGEEAWGFDNLKPIDEIRAKYIKSVE
ncbi:Piso0_000950 [Millerozyma farinosa CBS 7064]|uniref:Piso0_000950 protein n=1 Tax=Pichia sorbitophila (strain ATCC MYA-4447 / BCRC 22081 / CBS 7064 / NBRC 10061 / NRRL Y-12695) TaxID=559304 RepID=G8YQI0_PICSO|nr:Piso0_000950 [Millerozyma farinosa CBS 7064]